MNLSTVYNQIAVLFLLLIAGYTCGKVKVITQGMVESLTTFVVKIATPALIVGGMIIPRTPEKLKASILIVVSSFGIYAGSFIIGKIVAKAMGTKPAHEGIFRFGMMFANVGFMGFPVIQALFGQEAIFYTAMFNIPFNILVYTVGIALVNTKSEDHIIDLKSFINPGVIASIIGFSIFVLAIPVPGMIKEVIVLIGSTTTPMSMLVIGAMLSTLPILQMFTNWRIYVVGIVRVLVIPLIVYAVLKFGFKIDDIMLLGVPVIITAMPVGANAALITQEYGNEPEVASQCIFISILMSTISIPLLSLLFI